MQAFPPWSGWDVLAVLVVTVATVFGFSILALGLALLTPAYRHVPLSQLATNTRVVVGSQAAAYFVVVLFMLWLVRSRTEESFSRAIRWNWPGNRALAYLVSGSALAIVVETLSRYLPIPKSIPMDQYFNDTASAYLMAAFGMTLAPLVEELFFRGMLYPVIRRAWGLTLALVLTAAAFAAIHGAQLGYAWGPILSIFIVGLTFTTVRARTASVARSFLMHVGYNTTLFTLLWFASDHFRHMEKALS